jgi:hypothetical protein
MTKTQQRYRSKKTGRYVSKTYASRHPDATFADRPPRRQRVSLLLAAAGVAVAVPAIAAATYKRLAR